MDCLLAIMTCLVLLKNWELIIEVVMMDDTISRQAAIELVGDLVKGILSDSATMSMKMSPDYLLENLYKPIRQMPSAQSERLTDNEQRIFLAAMGREEKICKQVDDECRDFREPYEDGLVRMCHEIIRKVKGALWT